MSVEELRQQKASAFREDPEAATMGVWLFVHRKKIKELWEDYKALNISHYNYMNFVRRLYESGRELVERPELN